MKLAWCPLLHTPSGRTPGLQCEKAVETVFSWGLPSQISIVKPKRGVGSHVEKGWDPAGPTASHRTRFAPQVEKSWDLPGPTGPDLGLTVRLASALLYVGVQWDAVGPGVRGGGPMIAS